MGLWLSIRTSTDDDDDDDDVDDVRLLTGMMTSSSMSRWTVVVVGDVGDVTLLSSERVIRFLSA